MIMKLCAENQIEISEILQQKVASIILDRLELSDSLLPSIYNIVNNWKKMHKNNLLNKSSRKAFFCCALSIYFPDNNYRVFEGKKYGHVQFPPLGKNGFGYDPMFVPNGYKKTFGEMNFDYKERISHRSIAFKKLKKYLERFID